MAEEGQEILQFDGVQVPIYRSMGTECYIAMRPPHADPYIVAPQAMDPNEIIAFAQERIDVIRELREEMEKRFKKSPSLNCRYQTGDVAYLLGRPFMIRVYPSAKNSLKKVARGRATVRSNLEDDVSVLNLFVLQTGNFDQRKMAFSAWAEKIYLSNLISRVADCLSKAVPEEKYDLRIILADDHGNRRRWVRVDWQQGVVSFSRMLIAFPSECSVYVFMSALASRILGDEASEEDRDEFIARGCPTWEHAKGLLGQEDSIYLKQ